ncbi:hypothetical protein [Acetobacter senegalensis]|nr:hypothetical protein [Acetobacter senegalensis]
MPEDVSEATIKAQAYSYIMLCLLQRLERREPGLINDLLDGIKADYEASKTHAQNRPPVSLIFEEAISFLARAKQGAES